MNVKKINAIPPISTLFLMALMLATPQCEKMERFGDGIPQGDRILDAELKAAELTTAEEEAILFIREEEKLARDVYEYLYEIYTRNPFENIMESEQRHMDAVKNLIICFDLTDPVTDDTRGAFTNQDLADLYKDLTSSGETSWELALEAGVQIEEMDIGSLEEALEIAVGENVIRVFTNLKAASERHLEAFESHLEAFSE